ncbi:MAG: PadR family transcriptional regulator [Actinobacteria bacterium]|nr:PadR family transcriptional regulator [Actinomycetota bacterium]
MRTSPERTKLSNTEYAVLGLLANREEQSGYDLLRTIERSIGYMWAPAKSGLYNVLGRLETAGLVAGREVKERGPSKALYRLTGSGRAALEAWASDPALELRQARDPFLLKLFFSRYAAPGAAIAQVEAYRQHVERLLGEWEAQEREAVGEGDAVDLIALRYALIRARSTLVWCDETLETLRRSNP